MRRASAMTPLGLWMLMAGMLLTVGCSSQSTRPGEVTDRSSYRGSYPVIPASATASFTVVQGDFAGSSGVEPFMRRMQAQGFTPAQVAAILSGAKREQWIIDAMNRQAPRPSTGPTGAWIRYRAKFLTEANITNGVRFWRENQAALERAQARYGVPPEYVVAIIGVETRYGGYLGRTRIIDALSTLAFAYPRRSDYFTDELESFLIMTRDEGIDPFSPRGSFAGAMGLGQFMPSSFRDYAVDFDGDGDRDLWNPTDAIGSVANYFKAHGWQARQPVVVRAQVGSGGVGALKVGFDTRYGVRELQNLGITPTGSLGNANQASLIRLDMGSGYEYWLGLQNFYTITRYNHSSYYAMAVHQLAQAIKSRHQGTGATRVSQQLEELNEIPL
ncbi:lytic murein transglycosylase B [Thiocapsa imhoffii]|uniref:Lytic murein transglycosylase B n=1 Tax=Thiocapsa imhoffii TaxID=382777 RepID=A0A9X1B9J0_9GAMM|nr:lytic murein transglycosylase B [Thiocapsa imhoffii]MBK1645917.1 lytic murein transglycosylase B [Thiocapsa imhoffii]